MSTAATSPRFRFGKNWTNYLVHVNEERIQQAASDLHKLVGDLGGKTFLDVGCGSGIHSLAAVRLGANRVFSFDYDSDSVSASQELRRRTGNPQNWHIEQGSVLDEAYMRQLGSFDVVYSWGVLHHTGNLKMAMINAAIPSRDFLAISLYDDKGWSSRAWKITKRAYSRSAAPVKSIIVAGTFLATWGKSLAYNSLLLRPGVVIQWWKNYSRDRGMSPWTDLVDWAGGYPFEVCTPTDVISLYENIGFRRQTLRPNGATTEFVLKRLP